MASHTHLSLKFHVDAFPLMVLGIFRASMEVWVKIRISPRQSMDDDQFAQLHPQLIAIKHLSRTRHTSIVALRAS
jgi:hypothetical protein